MLIWSPKIPSANSKERLGDVCVLRHVKRHLQCCQ